MQTLSLSERMQSDEDALKYTKAGDTITINVRQDGNNAIIEVVDSGSGINADEIDKIFDCFYQTERVDSLTSNVGTGIGLALTKGIVESNHGRISVESEVGKGSRFVITLKLGNKHFKEDEVSFNDEVIIRQVEELPYSTITAIMEEAPIAILSEEISIVERSNEQSKRSRNRKMKQRTEQEVKMNPIAEGGDLALIEAGQIVKQAKNKKTVAPKEAAERMLYISRESDEQVEVVITEKGIIAEYFVEMVHQTKIRGNIYKGIVNNIDSNLQAAFVNFGTGKNGFLQIDEIHSEYWNAPHLEGSKYPPIQKAIKIGQEILVQVVKEPSGNKGAFLTTWVSIAGRFLVLTPGQEQIGVSRKVTDHEERARLKDLLSGINPGDDLGVIIRTVSEGASKVSIKKDLQYLKRIWKDISRKIAKQKSPSIVYQEADLAFRAIRDYLSENIREIWVDSPEILNSLTPFISLVLPKKLDILKLHESKTKNIWETFNLVSQLEEVTKREVNLPSGGGLVFDQTEALMAIDINSGKTHGKINFENMVFRTNMEAAESIARHLRMRDVGGQVVIDFIEMKDRGHIREVEKTLRDAMHGDKARHDIGSISSFGLLELVRQRTGSSAISLSSEPCPHCQGTGFRRNMEWQAQKMLRELKNKLLLKKTEGTYVYEIESEVGLYILNRKRDRLSELEEQFQIKLEIRLR